MVASGRTKDIVLIGDAIDLLPLLLHYVDMKEHELFLAQKNQTNNKNKRMRCIKQSKRLLESCDLYVLFIHAIQGCDMTGHLFGLGKGSQ